MSSILFRVVCVNTLRPRQHGRHFADDTFKRIFLNENVEILIEVSLKFVHKGPINNIPALVQIMAWRQPGDKPLSEPMVVRLPTHICVTRPQWVKCAIQLPCLIRVVFSNLHRIQVKEKKHKHKIHPCKYPASLLNSLGKVTVFSKV